MCTYDSEELGCSLRNLIHTWWNHIYFLCSKSFDYTILQCFIGVLIQCTIPILHLKVFLSSWRHFCDDNGYVDDDGDDDDDDVFSHLTRLDFGSSRASYINISTPQNDNMSLFVGDAPSQPSVCTEKTRVWSYRRVMGIRSATCPRQPCLVVCIMVLHKRYLAESCTGNIIPCI
jgi:hypothetical protein